MPISSAIESVDAGDNLLHVVLVVANSHRVAVEVVSAGGVPIAVACSQDDCLTCTAREAKCPTRISVDATISSHFA